VIHKTEYHILTGGKVLLNKNREAKSSQKTGRRNPPKKPGGEILPKKPGGEILPKKPGGFKNEEKR
jgi:hypothetical protein